MLRLWQTYPTHTWQTCHHACNRTDQRTNPRSDKCLSILQKKTFLLIRALESSNHEQRKELEKWIGAVNYNPDEKIAAVKNIYDELNLKSLVENLIEKYYLASLECLSSISVPDNRKKDLKDLSENLMYRDK